MMGLTKGYIKLYEKYLNTMRRDSQGFSFYICTIYTNKTDKNRSDQIEQRKKKTKQNKIKGEKGNRS